MKKAKRQFLPKPRACIPKTTTEFRQLVATMKIQNTLEVLNNLRSEHPQNKGEIELVMDLIQDKQQTILEQLEKDSLEVK